MSMLEVQAIFPEWLIDDDVKVKSDREIYEDYLNGMSDEEIATTGYSRDDMLEAYDSEKEEDEERLAKLWETLLADSDAILECSDEEIIAAYLNNSRTCVGTEQGEWKVQFVKPWVDKRYSFTDYRETHENLYCAPAALGIVLGGYYSAKSSVDCSEYVERLVANGLKEIGAEYYFGMTDALSKSCNDELGLKFHLCHGFDDIWNDMKKFDAPIISLRIGNERSVSWPYRTVIGLAQRAVPKNHQFLWMKWTTYTKTDYYYMADNGADFYESIEPQPVTLGTYVYGRGGQKFWEKSGSNGGYFQHFAVDRHK